MNTVTRIDYTPRILSLSIQKQFPVRTGTRIDFVRGGFVLAAKGWLGGRAERLQGAGQAAGAAGGGRVRAVRLPLRCARGLGGSDHVKYTNPFTL